MLHIREGGVHGFHLPVAQMTVHIVLRDLRHRALPEIRANLFLRLVLQNGGRLSARKRGLFLELSDDEVAALERAANLAESRD